MSSSIANPNSFHLWYAAGHCGVQHRFAETSRGICRGGGQQSRSSAAVSREWLVCQGLVRPIGLGPEAARPAAA
jgi:hypothetical protein